MRDFADLLKLAPADGYILELGVAHGTSFNLLCAAAYPRKVYGFDSFRGLPEDWTSVYTKGMFDRRGVPPYPLSNGEYVIGWVEATLGPWLSMHSGEISFVHFDLDLYSPTDFALTQMQDRFIPGTILLFDEFDDSLPGHEHEQRAFYEFQRRSGWRTEFIGKRTAYAHAFRLTERRATNVARRVLNNNPPQKETING
jgi:hypothetical protein